MTKVFATRVKTKVVNTVLVLAVLASMYTGIKTLTFCTGLNTSCTGHIPANFGQYRQGPGVSVGIEKRFFFFFFFFTFVIFEFSLGQNGNLFVLTY